MERAGQEWRHFAAVVNQELSTALHTEGADDGTYGQEYFEEGLRSRKASLSNVMAYLVWRVFPDGRSLDVGCALGFTVQALREVGFDAVGVDFSRYAVAHCPPQVAGRVQWADLLSGLPFPDGSFDVVTAFEILEHLPPQQVPDAIAELRRVTGGHLLVTTPSFGPNEHGPDGWFRGKVRWDRLEHYEGLDPAYTGPVPHEDLLRDDQGQPIEGHLTISSFAWWQQRFEDAGFQRCGDLEARLYRDIERFGRSGWWCLYVLAVPGTANPDAGLRSPDEVRRLERRWKLDRLEARVEERRAAGRR
jgi:SAM-dependent methyltransferase